MCHYEYGHRKRSKETGGEAATAGPDKKKPAAGPTASIKLSFSKQSSRRNVVKELVKGSHSKPYHCSCSGTPEDHCTVRVGQKSAHALLMPNAERAMKAEQGAAPDIA